ncbi:hypothetical protein QR680_006236 [Steinernema hermaphroditum]|uniref:Uncharacterized protein n=1 Tax=Steinernema hermaphroditum TaxID=289476 RepID=A0AA39HWZ8_9BILA|nr:hypothetical protein QR680_006236 [Steinernema hermaphroditum]
MFTWRFWVLLGTAGEIVMASVLCIAILASIVIAAVVVCCMQCCADCCGRKKIYMPNAPSSAAPIQKPPTVTVNTYVTSSCIIKKMKFSSITKVFSTKSKTSYNMEPRTAAAEHPSIDQQAPQGPRKGSKLSRSNAFIRRSFVRLSKRSGSYSVTSSDESIEEVCEALQAILEMYFLDKQTMDTLYRKMLERAHEQK